MGSRIWSTVTCAPGRRCYLNGKTTILTHGRKLASNDLRMPSSIHVCTFIMFWEWEHSSSFLHVQACLYVSLCPTLLIMESWGLHESRHEKEKGQGEGTKQKIKQLPDMIQIQGKVNTGGTSHWCFLSYFLCTVHPPVIIKIWSFHGLVGWRKKEERWATLSAFFICDTTVPMNLKTLFTKFR